MTEIEVKWLAFAKKYTLLNEGEKAIWDKKLTESQKTYLNKILNQVGKDSAVVTTKNQISDLTSAPNKNPITLKNSNSFQNLNTESQNQIQTQANPVSAPNSKTLNMSMIMPQKNLDFGIPKAVTSVSTPSSTDSTLAHNLSKDEYLKKKKALENKNSLMQVVLVILVLALPLGSVVFALNNSADLNQSVSGSKAITQVLAGNSTINMSQLDDGYDLWIANYNDITAENKDKNVDADSDGLSNLEEMAFKTIPTNDRTCNSARLDGENILAGIDPLSCKPVNFNDPIVAAKYDGVVSRSTINQRLSVIGLNRFHTNSPIISPEERAGKLDINYDKNATLELLTTNPEMSSIAVLEVSWGQLQGTKDLVTNLSNQVVMYPDLGILGLPGVNYISGRHIDQNNLDSSIDLFSKLDQLSPGDGLKLTVETKDGGSKSFFYKVKNQNLVLASDPKQFTHTKIKDSELILASPWPDYSPEHRMVIKSVLDRVE